MAKQTFTTGQVLTAQNMTSLQQTAMLGGAASAKTANYTLVAADAGTVITMSNAGATTITVNSNLFAAGDTVTILNIGAGTCTITAGTATVAKPTNATLALVTSAGGVLYFTATGAATFMPFDVGSGGSSKNFSLIGTGTTNTGSTVTVSSLSGYDTFYVLFNGIGSDQSTNLTFRINGDTASNYYRVGGYGAFANAGNPYDIPNAYTLASSTSILLGIGSGNQDQVFSGWMIIEGSNSAGKKMWTQATYGPRGSGTATAYALHTGGYYDSSSVISSMSVIASSGTFDAGTFAIYGSA